MGLASTISTATFQQAFLQAAVPLALVDRDGRFASVNNALCTLLGYEEAELVNRDFYYVTHPDDFQISANWQQRLKERGCQPARIAKRYLHKSGREIWASVTVSSVSDSAGEAPYYIAHIQDETERRCAEWLEQDRRLALELVAQDRPLPMVLEKLVQLVERQMRGMQACILLLQDGAIRPFAPSLAPVLVEAIAQRPVSFAAGLTAPTAASEPVFADIEASRAWDGLRDEARAAGVACCWSLTISGSDAVPLGLLIVFSPQLRPPSAAERNVLETTMRLATISVEHHQTTRRLAHLVRHDPLTGLPNRILFEDRLDQSLTAARRCNSSVALFALDVNRFKHVNDTLGHQAGDSLLQQFSGRLRGQLRENDTLARVGGDEFMVLLPDAAGYEGAELVANRLINALAAAPFEVGGRSLTATTSIGIAFYPDDGQDGALLQRAADAAMYRAKAEGRRGDTIVSVARFALREDVHRAG